MVLRGIATPILCFRYTYFFTLFFIFVLTHGMPLRPSLYCTLFKYSSSTISPKAYSTYCSPQKYFFSMNTLYFFSLYHHCLIFIFSWAHIDSSNRSVLFRPCFSRTLIVNKKRTFQNKKTVLETSCKWECVDSSHSSSTIYSPLYWRMLGFLEVFQYVTLC